MLLYKNYGQLINKERQNNATLIQKTNTTNQKMYRVYNLNETLFTSTINTYTPTQNKKESFELFCLL